MHYKFILLYNDILKEGYSGGKKRTDELRWKNVKEGNKERGGAKVKYIREEQKHTHTSKCKKQYKI